MAHRQPDNVDDPERVNRIDSAVALSTVIPVALAFATLAGNKWSGGFPVPPTSIVLGVVVACAAFVVPTRGIRRPAWATLLVLAIPAWLAITAYLNQVVEAKRTANILMLTFLVLVISSGRVCVVSVGRGAGIAVVFGAAWGFLTFGSSSYSGRLTGGWGDPNNAGMCVLVLSCLALAYVRNPQGRILIGLTSVATIAATFSRTSLFALGIVVIWVFAGDRIKLWMRTLIVGAIVWYVTTLPQGELTAGVFAGREGSDALRDRIDDATAVAVNQHPLYGTGPGTAQTIVDGNTFFFHNSYEALRAEGGWVFLAIVLLIYTFIFISLHRLPQSPRGRWIEAALIGALVCAVNLGEVFFAPPVMIALGVAIRYIVVSRRKIVEIRSADVPAGGATPTTRPQALLSSSLVT